MSSEQPTLNKGLFSTFLASYHTTSEDDNTDKPAEKPAEPTKTMWKPGGYTPSRASWHTVRGRIKSYLS